MRRENKSKDKCLYSCEGIDIISYDEFYVKNDQLITEEVLSLSDQYEKYKRQYTFPTRHKSNSTLIYQVVSKLKFFQLTDSDQSFIMLKYISKLLSLTELQRTEQQNLWTNFQLLEVPWDS